MPHFRLILILPLLLPLPLAISAQTFVTTIGQPESQENGLASIEMPDGSIYLVGNIQSDTTNGSDVLFAKLDAEGNVLWTKSYDEGQSEVAYDCIFKNGAFVIIGEAIVGSPFNADGFILRLDEDGNKISFEKSGSPTLNEQYYGLGETPTGFVIAGRITSSIGVGNDVLVRYVGGSPVDGWERVHGSPQNDIGMAVRQLPDGKFMVSGDRQVEPMKYNPFVMVLNDRGDLLHDQAIDSDFNGGCKNMTLMDDGTALVIGELATPTSSAFDIFLAKVDTTATTQWLHYVPSTDASDAGFDVVRANSGSYLLTGYSWNEAAGNSDIVVISVDSEGNEVERAYFGGPELDIGYDLKVLSGGGFLVTGKTAETGGQDAIIIRNQLELATAVKDPAASVEQLRLSPNPVPVGGTVRLPAGWEGAKWWLFDAMGKLVGTSTITMPEMRLDVPAGNYFLQLQHGDRTGTAQVSVQ